MTKINKNHSDNSCDLERNIIPKYLSGKKKSRLTNYFSSKLDTALTFVLIGFASTLLLQNSARPHKYHFLCEDVFADDFLNNDAFFSRHKQSQQTIEDILVDHQKTMGEAFKKQDKTSDQSKVTTKEDADFYYFELSFFGLKKEEIIVIVKDTVVNFSANKKTADGAESSFNYSFYVPQYDPKQDPEIIRNDNSISLKLRKKRTTPMI